ncbi:uracil-DNA glycosylase [Frigidibacter sp. ROC022]|uniref:uracil-DNA glycosylase n=1 Tax=Frigidibacter sp. ROC022 TaxID=2971796 RepID=UPI00215B4862|nr:uracil-DNA glycosylase [Frigidibacter sp. ROC022]MCR8725475.1 uracil-DNA glycosylase [Frigidibacter sp. ROC022]
MFDLSRLGAWAELPFFRDGLAQVEAGLAADPRPVLPPAAQVFAALEATPPGSVRVVLLGQDPYPTPGHAHGFAFSVAPGTPLPKSLKNIFRELRDDLGIVRDDGDLRGWAAQGVLLLNTVLTVPEGAADGHRRLGWQALTRDILQSLSAHPRAFLLWGRKAQKTGAAISGHEHLRITSSHPSPLGARAGPDPFFGSRPFSRVNAWLEARGEAPIDWSA